MGLEQLPILCLWRSGTGKNQFPVTGKIKQHECREGAMFRAPPFANSKGWGTLSCGWNAAAEQSATRTQNDDPLRLTRTV